MSTKRKRLEEQLLIEPATHDVELTLRRFVETAPEGSTADSSGRCASLAECYLVYCYLCRTGLWADISLRLSACGAFYLSCTPETVKRHVEEEPGAKAARAEVEAEAEAEEEPPQPELAAAGEAEPQLEPAEPSGEGAGEGEEEDWQAPGLDAEVEAAMAATAAAEAAETIRVRTLAVPMSVANSAPTPSRLHQLLALSDAEGAPVSLALVASDGTVIVSHIYRGMKPPDVLDADEDADDF